MAIIRAAVEGDIPRILELYEDQLVIDASPSETEYDSSLDDYRRAFSEIKAMPRCELIVAEEQGEVIGTAMLVIVPNLSHKALPWAVVENVVVDSKHRRRGIGKLLMESLISSFVFGDSLLQFFICCLQFGGFIFDMLFKPADLLLPFGLGLFMLTNLLL